ncbi:MAG: hypothetical protein JWO03_742 [Bacteroidetes bacterium]|nr:hypothetical protein [Bacteroidota bacterium]
MKRIRILILLVPLLILSGLRSVAQDIHIRSDNTWLVDTLVTDTLGWSTNSYDDALWGSSVIATDTSCIYPGFSTSALGALMWISPSTGIDTPKFFRKHFTVPCLSRITDATISFAADYRGQVFLNGLPLGSVAAADGIVTYDYTVLQPYLYCGENIIAIEAEDTTGPCRWVYFAMDITLQTLSISTDTTITSCDSVYIGDPNGPVGPGYGYTWSSLTPGTPDPAINDVPYTVVNPQVTSIYMFIVQTPCCIDTLYDTVNVTLCCTRPTAVLSIDSTRFNNDTLCRSGLLIVTASGGTWGRYYIDDPASGMAIVPIPSGGRLDTIPTDGVTSGTHTLCFIAFTDDPDSTNHWCSDTICFPFLLYSCCTRPTAQLSVDSSTSQTDSICIGSSITLRADGGSWGEYIIDGIPTTEGIVSIPVGGRTDVIPIPWFSLGTHTLCFVAFTANPDSTTDWCADTICVNLVMHYCSCSVQATLTINADTICTGDSVSIHGTGAAWGKFYVDNGAVVSDLQFIPPGGSTYAVPRANCTEGWHTFCFITYSSNPDSTTGWCADTACVLLIVQNCNCSMHAVLTDNADTFCTDEHFYLYTTNGGTIGQLIFDDIYPAGPIDTLKDTLGPFHVDPGFEGTHHACLVVYSAYPDSSGGWCSDTVCLAFEITACGCHAHATLTVSDDTFCVGQPVGLYSTGGAYGQYVIDNGADASGIKPEPPGGSYDTIPSEDITPGVHTICYIAFSSDPDSTTGWCSDTTCVTFVVQACSCYVHASLSIDTDHICVGQAVYVHTGNGGQFGTVSMDGRHDQEVFRLMSDMGPLIPGPDDIGTHTICLMVYGDSLDHSCGDTVCLTITVRSCGCDSLAGKTRLKETHNDLSYDFYNASDMHASYIDWFIDDELVEQTTGEGHLNYELTPGYHHVCMRAAFILPVGDGTNVCCYVEECDTIAIDMCASWKTTDNITYTQDVNNYHNFTFQYHGNTDPTPTVIWHFGDGGTQVNDGSAPTNYQYNHAGSYNVCATVIWSLSDSVTSHDSLSVCCCVDTICFDVNVSPCATHTLSISEDPDGYLEAVFAPSLTFAPASVVWIVTDNSAIPPTVTTYPDPSSGIISSSLISPFALTSDQYSVKVDINYTASTSGEPDTSCFATVTQEFNTNAEDGKDGMRKYYPNPTKNIVTVEVNAWSTDKAVIEMLDNTGRTVKKQQHSNLSKGFNQLYVNVNEFAMGLYLMKVTVGDNIQMVKVVKD